MIQLTWGELESIIERTAERAAQKAIESSAQKAVESVAQQAAEAAAEATAQKTAEAILAKKSKQHSAAIKAGLAKSGRAVPPPQDIEKHAEYYTKKVKEHKEHTGDYPTLRAMRRYLEHRLPQEVQREQVRKYCFENHWIRWVPQSSLDAAKGKPQRVMPVE